MACLISSFVRGGQSGIGALDLGAPGAPGASGICCLGVELAAAGFVLAVGWLFVVLIPSWVTLFLPQSCSYLPSWLLSTVGFPVGRNNIPWVLDSVTR